MELTPIDGSSRIAAAGYDVETRVIRVRFHDATEHDYPDQPPEMWAAFQVAPSKGRFLNALGSGRAAKPVQTVAGPLDTYEPDECCGAPLSRALRKGISGDTWCCPKCGCEWQPETIGAVRHWTARPWAMVISR